MVSKVRKRQSPRQNELYQRRAAHKRRRWIESRRRYHVHMMNTSGRVCTNSLVCSTCRRVAQQYGEQRFVARTSFLFRVSDSGTATSAIKINQEDPSDPRYESYRICETHSKLIYHGDEDSWCWISTGSSLFAIRLVFCFNLQFTWATDQQLSSQSPILMLASNFQTPWRSVQGLR